MENRRFEKLQTSAIINDICNKTKLHTIEEEDIECTTDPGFSQFNRH